MRRLTFVALAISTLLLSGCWDPHDISDRTPALALGFDYAQGQGWHVSLSEAILSQGSSTLYTGDMHSGDGATLTEAVEQMRTHLARRFYLGSAKVFVLGKGVLESRTSEVLRTLLQHNEVDLTGYVLGTRGTAEQLLAHPDGAMGLTAVRLLKEFESEAESRDGHIKEPLWETLRTALQPGGSVRLPVFDELPTTSVKAVGTAIIGPDGRLATILGREESVTLRWLLGRAGRNVLVLDDGSELKTQWTSTSARFAGDAHHLLVHIRARAEVYKTSGLELPLALDQEFAASAARAMVQRCQALIPKLQAAGVDAADWSKVAQQAGLRGFDIRSTTVTVTASVNVAPHFSPSF